MCCRSSCIIDRVSSIVHLEGAAVVLLHPALDLTATFFCLMLESRAPKSHVQSWHRRACMSSVNLGLNLHGKTERMRFAVNSVMLAELSFRLKVSCVSSADPLSMSPQKALETIGANLQKQYENWQPRVSECTATSPPQCSMVLK